MAVLGVFAISCLNDLKQNWMHKFAKT